MPFRKRSFFQNYHGRMYSLERVLELKSSNLSIDLERNLSKTWLSMTVRNDERFHHMCDRHATFHATRFHSRPLRASRERRREISRFCRGKDSMDCLVKVRRWNGRRGREKREEERKESSLCELPCLGTNKSEDRAVVSVGDKSDRPP